MSRVRELLEDPLVHAKLCDIFPNAVQILDFTQLGVELKLKGLNVDKMIWTVANSIQVSPERNDFNWPGKARSEFVADAPPEYRKERDWVSETAGVEVWYDESQC